MLPISPPTCFPSATRRSPPTSLFSLPALNSLLAGSGASLCAEQWRRHTRCIGWDGWRGLASGADGMEDDGSAEQQQEPEVGGSWGVPRCCACCACCCTSHTERVHVLPGAALANHPLDPFPIHLQLLCWFWMLVGAMREGQRAALLRFWTSLPSLPSGGFGALPQPLTLVRAEHASQRLPRVGGVGGSWLVC